MATTSADQIFKEFREHSAAQFFKKNRQMLGYSGQGRSLVTIVHEFCTNSLDAAEEAGILPDIDITIKRIDNGTGISRYSIRVGDNGPGVPKSFVGKALGTIFAGTKFHRYMQQRGQQGIGAAGCVLFAQITTGKPIFIKSSTGKGAAYSCRLGINAATNKPVITEMRDLDEDFRGLVIEGEYADIRYEAGEHSAYEYIRRTALSNPHAQIKLTDPGGQESLFVRSVKELPRKASVAKPHPAGLSANDILEFAHASQSRKISTFMIDTFARTTQNKISELKAVDGTIDVDKDPKQMTWEDAEKLIGAIHKVRWIAPDASSVIPIGEAQIKVALKNILDPEHMSVTERRPAVFRGGIPFVVEAAVSYGGNSGRKVEGGYAGNVLRFANRVPLLFDTASCAISKAANDIEWRRYNIDMDTQPVSVFVNVSSVYVPYSGVGKEAIAQEDEIIDEIKLAIMEAARGVQHYVRGKEQVAFNINRYKAIARYVKQLSGDISDLTKADRARIEKRLESIVSKRFPKSEEREREKGQEEER
ncbi:MAG: DNA topoisomerase VI subunit B [Candidatus Marsarchaeota archaeon]|jgi:DNA topoisomerase-6 subunit B|nr:DNA topoisomerase VI subunit B [Candidatus Marsarchaeota archaeon]MCL5111787.1 DNA topoisomerase VI subunit B [Candidatus Marsarchaeota archaeon]